MWLTQEGIWGWKAFPLPVFLGAALILIYYFKIDLNFLLLSKLTQLKVVVEHQDKIYISKD